MLQQSFGAPVDAALQYLSEVWIGKGNIVMSALETEDPRIAVSTRPSQYIHTVRVIDRQQDRTVITRGLHGIGFVAHLPVGETFRDWMRGIGDLHL